MADRFSKEHRSWVMGRVKGGDTRPEMTVRKAAHRLGYRFRLHRRDLPGKPDLVFPKFRKAIFVHGCFWHSHKGCRRATIPASNAEFWTAKLRRNVERDTLAAATLTEEGWEVLVIWECQTKSEPNVENILRDFLRGTAIQRESEGHAVADIKS